MSITIRRVVVARARAANGASGRSLELAFDGAILRGLVQICSSTKGDVSNTATANTILFTRVNPHAALSARPHTRSDPKTQKLDLRNLGPARFFRPAPRPENRNSEIFS